MTNDQGWKEASGLICEIGSNKKKKKYKISNDFSGEQHTGKLERPHSDPLIIIKSLKH